MTYLDERDRKVQKYLEQVEYEKVGCLYAYISIKLQVTHPAYPIRESIYWTSKS
jgi:hypothetical protein